VGSNQIAYLRSPQFPFSFL